MYCPSCGIAVAQELSYCKNCGAKLRKANADIAAKSPEIKPESLIQSIVAVFVCGIGAITILIGVMKAVLNLNVELIVGFALLSFLMMFIIEAVFIRLLLRSKGVNEEASGNVLLNEQTTTGLEQAPARVLTDPAPSVTENTTRIFEPVYHEPVSK